MQLSALLVSSFLALSIAPTSVFAWGSDGHQIIAAVAASMLSKNAKTNGATVLGQDTLDMSDASVWADSSRYQAKYSWSSELHYVNPAAYPPESCLYDDATDCSNDKCVTGAIRNFTNILGGSYAKPTDTTTDAMRFLIHFIEDVHQPLHTVTRETGGNSASVVFNGKSTNLHSLWDTGMLKQHITDNFGGSSANFTSYLISELLTGKFANSRAGFASCKTLETAYGGCPSAWAAESLQVNCDLIYVGYSSGMTISSTYYEKSISVIEKRLAAAAVRLATALDSTLGGTGIVSPAGFRFSFLDGTSLYVQDQ